MIPFGFEQAIAHAVEHKGNAHVALVASSQAEMRNMNRMALQILPEYAEYCPKPTTMAEWVFKDGARLSIRICESIDDCMQMAGSAYTMISTNVPSSLSLYFKSLLKSPEGVPCRMIRFSK